MAYILNLLQVLDVVAGLLLIGVLLPAERAGTTAAAITPRIATTSNTSINVKPERLTRRMTLSSACFHILSLAWADGLLALP